MITSLAILFGLIAVLAFLGMQMADAAAHTEPKYAPRTDTQSFPIADGQTIYRGSLGGIAAGYLDDWADGATDLFVGLIFGGDDYGRAAGANAGTLTGSISHARGAADLARDSRPMLGRAQRGHVGCGDPSDRTGVCGGDRVYRADPGARCGLCHGRFLFGPRALAR